METYLEYGLTARIVTPSEIMGGHRHQEIECTFIDGGRITYLLGTEPITIEAGRWTVFWAAVPHYIIYMNPNAKLYRLTIPLAWFLRWGLPQHIVEPVMNGKMILDERGDLNLDKAMFKRWCLDLDLESEERRTIVLLELEARVRRLTAYARIARISDIQDNAPEKEYPFFRAKRMAEYISQYYTEPITARQVAESVDLNPDYAISLFKKYFQLSISDYIMQYRVAHAQQLLVTSELSLTSIATRSGFSSMSRFYAVFKASCHHTPKAYRSLYSIVL